MSEATAFTSEAFRHACGHFLTGVTVVTACGADGSPAGLTANSFTSVSLDPPLVLTCLENTSATLATLEQGSRFAIHVLGRDQSEVSSRFASSLTGAEKLAAVRWHAGILGVPILEAYAALFECSVVASHRAGDHTVIVGRVDKVDVRETEDPLGFYRGSYVSLARDGVQAVPEEATQLFSIGGREPPPLGSRRTG